MRSRVKPICSLKRYILRFKLCLAELELHLILECKVILLLIVDICVFRVCRMRYWYRWAICGQIQCQRSISRLNMIFQLVNKGRGAYVV